MLDSIFHRSGRSVDETAEEAFASVLGKAGATLPRRDAVDTRVTKEVRGSFLLHRRAEPWMLYFA
ncbi:MAG: hypothetical protein AB8B91_19355 [Rubripirellula sp.]